MSQPEGGGPPRETTSRLALRHAPRAVMEIAHETAARIVSRPVFRDRPDLDMSFPDVEPAFGLQVSSQLRHAARSVTADYIRYAREDGCTWHDIGAALGLEVQPDSPVSLAEAAYDYATADVRPERHTFTWICPACRRTILDRGPEAGHPGDCEPDHADDCPRQAAEVAAWNAFWDEEDSRS